MKKNIFLLLCGCIIGIISAIVFSQIFISQAPKQNIEEQLEIDSSVINYMDPYYNSDTFKQEMTIGVGGELP